jgi:hypothetical protein
VHLNPLRWRKLKFSQQKLVSEFGALLRLERSQLPSGSNVIVFNNCTHKQPKMSPVFRNPRPGTDVMIFKIFSPKIQRKNWRF